MFLNILKINQRFFAVDNFLLKFFLAHSVQLVTYFPEFKQEKFPVGNDLIFHEIIWQIIFSY